MYVPEPALQLKPVPVNGEREIETVVHDDLRRHVARKHQGAAGNLYRVRRRSSLAILKHEAVRGLLAECVPAHARMEPETSHRCGSDRPGTARLNGDPEHEAAQIANDVFCRMLLVCIGMRRSL